MRMTNEEYNEKRAQISENIQNAENDIWKEERECDEAAKFGDVPLYNIHASRMNEAETRLETGLSDSRQLEDDYWGQNDKHAKNADAGSEVQSQDAKEVLETDVEMSKDSQNVVQSENADYWDNSNSSSSLEQIDENENSLLNEASC